MSNENHPPRRHRSSRSHDDVALVSRDSERAPAPLGGVSALPKRFAKALDDAVNSRSASRGVGHSWESIPGLWDLTITSSSQEGASPNDPHDPFETSRGLGEAFDLSSVGPELGDLLTAPHEGPDGSRQVENGAGLAGPAWPVRPQGVGSIEPVSGGALRRAGDEAPDSLGPRLVPSSEAGPTPSAGARYQTLTVGRSGPVGLMTLPGPSVGGVSDPGSPGPSRQSDGASPTGRHEASEGAVDLSRANPIADQMAFAGASPDPADRAPETPYSVDLHDSSIAASAFGPLLSGPGASAPGEVAARNDPVGRGEPSQAPSPEAAWADQTVPESADQAGSPALDLSKTNELLQQLLDEVRRGRQSYLPVHDRNPSVL